MKETIPEIFLISRPQIDREAMGTYLDLVGGSDWLDSRGENDTHDLIEFAGRLCYRSWKVGLNPNVTKIRHDQREYFENMLSSAHGSVLEHANYTFVFHNVSRVFTHELVRHRAGSAFSQESLRYVRLTSLGFRVPPVLEAYSQRVIDMVEQLEEFQLDMAENLGLDNEGVPFHIKKEATSALRRLAPIGLSTAIVWTANIRTIRHVLASRTAEGAEEEIRYVFDHVGELISRDAPSLFQDFHRNEKGAWIPDHPVAGQTRPGS